MTLNCYMFEFLENYAGFRRFEGQQLLNNEDRPPYCHRQRCNSLNVLFKITFLACRFAVDFFARGFHIRTAVARLP